MLPDVDVIDSIRADAAEDEARALQGVAAQLAVLDLSSLAEAAAAAFDACAERHLARLLDVSVMWDDEAVAWAQAEFHAATGRLGQSLRRIVPGQDERHSLAQVLQQKMLEAELPLREALDSRAGSNPCRR